MKQPSKQPTRNTQSWQITGDADTLQHGGPQQRGTTLANAVTASAGAVTLVSPPDSTSGEESLSALPSSDPPATAVSAPRHGNVRNSHSQWTRGWLDAPTGSTGDGQEQLVAQRVSAWEHVVSPRAASNVQPASATARLSPRTAAQLTIGNAARTSQPFTAGTVDRLGQDRTNSGRKLASSAVVLRDTDAHASTQRENGAVKSGGQRVPTSTDAYGELRGDTEQPQNESLQRDKSLLSGR